MAVPEEEAAGWESLRPLKDFFLGVGDCLEVVLVLSLGAVELVVLGVFFGSAEVEGVSVEVVGVLLVSTVGVVSFVVGVVFSVGSVGSVGVVVTTGGGVGSSSVEAIQTPVGLASPR